MMIVITVLMLIRNSDCIFSVNSDPVEFKLYMVVVHGKDGQNVFCGDVCRLGKNFNTDSCMSSFNVDSCTCCK